MLPTLCKWCTDITQESAIGRELNSWPASNQEIAQTPIIDDVERVVVFSDPLDKVCTVIISKYWQTNIKWQDSPDFRISVDMVQVIYGWLFPLVSKEGENGAAVYTRVLASNSFIDSILPKTAESMMLEVCSWQLILWILEAANDASVCFALGSSTGENMTSASSGLLG